MSDAQVAGPQMVPHSREAEEAVIGSVFINPDVLNYEVSFLQADDFYIHRNRWIWEAYNRLRSEGTPIDFITVTEELDKMGHLADIGGSAYLTKLANACPSSLHAEAYAKRIQETAVRRRGLGNANQEAKDFYDESKDVNETIGEAQARLGKLIIATDNSTTVQEAAVSTIDIVAERADKQRRGEKVDVGYQTGIGYIDRNMKGLKKKWLVMFSGKPKVGKSRIVTQIAKTFAAQDYGLYISLEMDEESMIYRWMAMDLDISATDIEFGLVDPQAYIRSVERIPKNLGLWCTTRPTVEILQAVIGKQVYEHGLGWVVIDYVDLMNAGSSKRTETEEDKELWNDIKSKICMDLNVMVLAIESVNKLAADGIMTDDKVVGAYAKIHAVDVAFGYSPYHAIPHKGLPDISEDPDRERRCRVLNVMADRHRECTGIVMPLEMHGQLINDMEKKSLKPEGTWMGPQ